MTGRTVSVGAVDTIGFAGLGLIGGSLARAVRESGFADRCLGWDRSDDVVMRAVDLGIIDGRCDSLRSLADAVDLLVIATPTRAAETLLEELLTLAAEGGPSPLITDVASVKGSLCRIAGEAPAEAAQRFVPGHPIAGSERSGVEAARADLFRAHRVILTPLDCTSAAATQTVAAMWESTGATVVELPVDEHDAVLAATSHLPHAVAFALVNTLARSERSADIFRFAAGGFSDFTRIASSDPVMWRDVSLANAEALVEAIDSFSAQLADLRGAIESGDGAALEATFRAARSARDRCVAELPGAERKDTDRSD